MSGHSKWATIKHKKGAADARRGRVFTRLIKEISVAARLGGGDADSNARLRKAIATAKAENMPAENIDRAVQRGTGQLPGQMVEEVVLEGYGPGGVALLVEIATDNRNRTLSEIRHIFSKWGGNLGESGCVAWMFSKKGYLTLPRERVDEDTLIRLVLEAGAEDLRQDGSNWEIIAPPDRVDTIKDALARNKLEPPVAEVTQLAQNYVHLEGAPAKQLLQLIEALEEQEDVQRVHANFDIAEKEIEAALAAE